jgi:hypothetical protein
MRLVTYRDRDQSIKPGAWVGEETIDISDQVADVRSLIEEGADALGKLRSFLKIQAVVCRHDQHTAWSHAHAIF